MSIKNLAEDDRPREKFLSKGRDALSDSELLAIILGIGHREESALELARRILASVDNNWHKLSRLSLKDLMKFKGIGKVKAIEISTALEIGRRRALQEIPEFIKIDSASAAYSVLAPLLKDLPTEEFWAVYLNQSNKVIQKSRLAQGGIASSIVDIRLIFKQALEHYATGIIVAHNHPSGSLVPSPADIGITKKISEAGEVLQIRLLDHLIISQEGFFSFKEEGLL